MTRLGRKKLSLILLAALLSFCLMQGSLILHAENEETTESENLTGGGYAVTGQLENVGYSSVLYNAENGLPTSDANYVYASSDGYIWVGGYAGVMRYDGVTFERMDSSSGLTSAKTIFEDSQGRMWFGTNDNGIVLMKPDGSFLHYTYKENLPSSSVRGFAEDSEGRIYVGFTSGLGYIDENLKFQLIDDERINHEYIIRLTSDSETCVWKYKTGSCFFFGGRKPGSGLRFFRNGRGNHFHHLCGSRCSGHAVLRYGRRYGLLRSFW